MTSERPATPRDAATVALLRDGADGVETWLMHRSATMAFAPGMVVFPGGARDDRDLDLVGAALRETWEETGVRLERNALRPWARWITPPTFPIRYDTSFFVAALDGGIDPQLLGNEAERGEWCTPAAALRSVEAGDWQMMPPTIATLHQLAAHTTAADVLAAAPAQMPDPIRPERLL